MNISQKNIAKLLASKGNPVEVANFVMSVRDLYKIYRESVENIKEIEAKSRERVIEIEKKYEFLQDLFAEIFKERRLVIDKSFDVIKEGIQKGDNKIIAKGLETVCEVLSKSPFANLDQLGEALKSGKQINL